MLKVHRKPHAVEKGRGLWKLYYTEGLLQYRISTIDTMPTQALTCVRMLLAAARVRLRSVPAITSSVRFP